MKTLSISPKKKVLTHNLWEPLNGETTAKIDINVGDGNLTIDRLTASEQLLANGTLQYLENIPTCNLVSSKGQATLTIRGSGAGGPWFRFPWAACNGATEWHIHLNPTVSSDITAHSGGGNVKLDLAGMAITRVSADTGGGNLCVVLPDHAADLNVVAGSGGGNVTVEIGSGVQGTGTVSANSGAGNVAVQIPGDIEARIHATTGLGKVIMDSRFNKTVGNTYQSPDYESAANKVEITAGTGAGNVVVSIKI